MLQMLFRMINNPPLSIKSLLITNGFSLYDTSGKGLNILNF